MGRISQIEGTAGAKTQGHGDVRLEQGVDLRDQLREGGKSHLIKAFFAIGVEYT